MLQKISLHDFENPVDDIPTQICTAAENVGFFGFVDHGHSENEVQSMFHVSESCFSLADSSKATVPWSPQNVGWEKMSQVWPSTGEADTKDSYQLQFGENMENSWIDERNLPGFKARSLDFMHRVQSISEQIMVCIARGLGFDDDYFVKYHGTSRPDAQFTLRLLHYYETAHQ
jgi:isopenicillin N synthase-like dioxygenase